MILIIGLGNPGKEYETTRHNAGYIVLDALAKNKDFLPAEAEALDFSENKNFCAEIVTLSHAGEKIILAKPLTFMNNSGETVRKIADYYKIENKNIWVISDDFDLPLGTIRVRSEGSSGGHHGLDSIIEHLGTDKFYRIRLGICGTKQFQMKKIDEKPNYLESKDFVLSKFTPREKKIFEEAVNMVVEITVETLKEKEPVLECRTYEVK